MTLKILSFTFILSILFLFSKSVFPQINSNNIDSLFNNGLIELDNDEYSKAIEYFQKCDKMNPADIKYKYYIAYTNYEDKNFSDAIELLLKLINREDVTEKIFSVLASSYFFDDDIENAKKIIALGYKKFPNSSRLLFNEGLIEFSKTNFTKAVEFFIKGISKDPTYAPNYFWTSIICSESKERFWGILYGEIFMILTTGKESHRTMSKILFYSYRDALKFGMGGDAQLEFTAKQPQMPKDSINMNIPFECGVFVPLILKVTENESHFDIETLFKVRKDFIELYFKRGYNEYYQNALFDFHYKLINSKYFDLYNRWVFSVVADSDFEDYVKEHPKETKDFLKWLSENSMMLSKNSTVMRKIK